MTHGRNIQIRHHLPRQSVEARRSHSQADRWHACASSATNCIMLEGYLHISFMISVVFPGPG